MDVRAALTAALSGHYEIEREIGRGGMATVYLARDVKHDRRVAIKVLKNELVSVLGVQRFLSEIRVTANLQHPNVLPLFDSGAVDEQLYYVMPFVDGESLRARLDREKQLPVAEAVRIATAIASAAEYAHTHGVIHRDLKPENILLQSGEPIVADFGIAFAVSNAAGERVTQTGISLGTPHYMSPEQALGDRIVDARSDVYAIGAILYEMLAGEPPHAGSTSQAIIARVLTDRPRPVRESRPSVPEHVEATIVKALEKLPADRFSSAKEFADAVQGRGASVLASSIAPSGRRSSSISMIAAGVASLAAVAAGIGWWGAAHPRLPAPTRFTVQAPPGFPMGGATGKRVALSRDGQLLAFIAGSDKLFVRRLNQLDAIQFPKAAPARELHFSPDGKALVSVNQGPNKVLVDLDNVGAETIKLARLNKFTEATWTYSSDVVYLSERVLWRVPAGGGTPRLIASMDTTLDAVWMGPTMLPDGKTIALTVRPRDAASGSSATRLGLISIDGGARELLDLELSGVVGYVDGTLIFARGTRLSAVKLDLDRRKVRGVPVDLVEDLFGGRAAAALSDNGTLAYLSRGVAQTRMEILDERGVVTSALPEVRAYYQPTWSPDGKRLAMYLLDRGQLDIWVYDVESRQLKRLTQNGAFMPAWSHDGKRIAFIVAGNAFWMAADGSTAAEPVSGTSAFGSRITEVLLSPDGKYAVVRRNLDAGEPVGTPHVFVVPLAGGPTVPLLAGADNPSNLAISPNGKWVAYSARETGRHEVFVRSFPLGAGNVQISSEGGEAPRWSHDGRRLFYRYQEEFRSATLDVSGAMPRVMRSDLLELGRDMAGPRQIVPYAVHPDGKHFAVVRDVSGGAKLVVVTNWMTEVRAKLPGK